MGLKCEKRVIHELFSGNNELTRVERSLLSSSSLSAVTFSCSDKTRLTDTMELYKACQEKVRDAVYSNAFMSKGYKVWCFVPGWWTENNRINTHLKLWKSFFNNDEWKTLIGNQLSYELELTRDGEVRYSGLIECKTKDIHVLFDYIRGCRSFMIISKRADIISAESLKEINDMAFYCNTNSVSLLNIVLHMCSRGDIIISAPNCWDWDEVWIDLFMKQGIWEDMGE